MPPVYQPGAFYFTDNLIFDAHSNEPMHKENFKSVKHSRTTITELMLPSYTNFGGKVHGGILLSLMDKVAYVCSAMHAGTYCVTASIDSVNFLAPVEVGELVSLKASVNYVGKTSLIVGIRVVSQNVKTQQVKHTNTSYFTMVAMDDEHKPVQVPGLILETTEEVRRFLEAMRRKEHKKAYMEKTEQLATPADLENAVHLLKNERCILKESLL